MPSRQLHLLVEGAIDDLKKAIEPLYASGWGPKVEVEYDDESGTAEIHVVVQVTYPSPEKARMLPFSAEQLARDAGADLEQPLNEGEIANRRQWEPSPA